ncbi:ribonuclease III [Deferribacter desulfuricans SSM1]|uniref:Ribonuclease 3 n=1 Tax=Deferribacter desulfuricans (strain DSM 14783 / JCM 11476 / NBRC 101012 / SSM1) TaxID=639282 RepID=D3PAP4_DEFDS|nr:ribonuclease III [Deferribacter desulfuricans]BAI79667.1 ribonuclease III [Deferribacter desulfuricans SSM1]
MSNIEELEELIGYRFKNKSLLLEALTHSSYAYEKKLKRNYERLEFLGDSVLQLIVTEYLVIKYKEFKEGVLSKYRSFFVSEDIISEIALKIRLNDFLMLGKGEIVSGGYTKPSILADIFESLLGAVYLDGGYNEARRIVLMLMSELMDEYIEKGIIIDPKTELQKITQQKFGYIPEYKVLKEEGPEHDKVFTVELKLADGNKFIGVGRNKKKAEIDAASKALTFLQDNQLI